MSMSNLSYNEKYLKYKNKYLALKDLVGGFTYDLKDPKQKEKATTALLSAGIGQPKIDELYAAIKKYKSVKRNDAELPYDERFHVKLIHGNLKFFYEDELKNLNPIPIVMSQNEKRDSSLTDTDNLPDHLPASELSPLPLSPVGTQKNGLPPAYGLFGSPESEGSELNKSKTSSQLNSASPVGLYGDMTTVKKYYSY